MSGTQPTNSVIVRDFRGSRLFLTNIHPGKGMRWTTERADAMTLSTDDAMVICERASREYGAKCAVQDATGTMAQPAVCRGSLQWPKASTVQNTFWCEHCGHVFGREQLRGRDDHMPSHYPANAEREIG